MLTFLIIDSAGTIVCEHNSLLGAKLDIARRPHLFICPSNTRTIYDKRLSFGEMIAGFEMLKIFQMTA